MADHLAHQAVDDYQSMNFECPDENIMIITNCKKLGPYEGPEQGSDGLWYLMELLILLTTELVL